MVTQRKRERTGGNSGFFVKYFQNVVGYSQERASLPWTELRIVFSFVPVYRPLSQHWLWDLLSCESCSNSILILSSLRVRLSRREKETSLVLATLIDERHPTCTQRALSSTGSEFSFCSWSFIWRSPAEDVNLSVMDKLDNKHTRAVEYKTIVHEVVEKSNVSPTGLVRDRIFFVFPCVA